MHDEAATSPALPLPGTAWRSSLLIAVGMCVLIGSLIFSAYRVHDVEKEMARNDATIGAQRATIEAQRKKIEVQEASIRRNNDRIGKLVPAALKSYGWEGATDPRGVRESLAADDALRRIAPAAIRNQRVLYYAKSPEIDINQENFIARLKELGFTVTISAPLNPRRASNALWYGAQVHPEAIRAAAYALLRAGYPVQHIGPLREPNGPKANLIEIGVAPFAASRAPITVDQVRTLSIE